MKRLAIVGTHPGTRDQGPFDNLDYDIWVFNEAPQAEWCKRWTATFQLHKPEVYTSPNNMVRADHWDWLQQDHGIDKTIYLQEHDDRIPNGTRFLIDEIKQFVPAAKFGLFTSTVSMAIALGLYLGYETIELWGVDLGSNTEYTYQLPGFLFWVGVAAATLGDKFILHSGLQHFTNRVYGYEGETQIERAFFTERAEFFDKERKGHESTFNKLKGRLANALIDFKPTDFYNLITACQNAAQDWGRADGGYQEAHDYAERTDPISAQQFERRGAKAQLEGDETKDKMNQKFGEVTYLWNTWSRTRQYEAMIQLKDFSAQLLTLAIKVGGFAGVMDENRRYMIEYADRVQAAGGERTLKALGVNQ